jgi:predicted nucleic acid-binding protein
VTTDPLPIQDLPIRSDNLAALREVIQRYPVLAQHLGEPKTIRLVLDANVLVADVRWIVKKRTNPQARTALQEILASGLLVAFAPSYLEQEMQSQLAAVADEEGLPRDALFAEWAEYRRALKFYEALPPADGLTSHGFDPKDAPYVETYFAVGATAIMTSDPHLKRMGAQTVSVEMSVKLQAYARDESVDLTLRLGAVVLGTFTIASAIGFAKLVLNAIRYFSRLPAGVQIIVGGCLIGILLHQPTRDRLVEMLVTSGHALRRGFDNFMPVFLQLAEVATQRRESARLRWSEIEPHLRHSQRLDHAAAQCPRSPNDEGEFGQQELLVRPSRRGSSLLNLSSDNGFNVIKSIP